MERWISYEEKLWSALETVSHRKEINYIHVNGNQDIRIIPKIIICVDGIDESRPYDIWLDRMREVEVINTKHPRIRFCISK